MSTRPRVSSGNPYCDACGIDVPRMEDAIGKSDAVPYSLFMVALLEAGEPLTIEQAAQRMAEAGFGTLERSTQALKRSRPDRAPIYRHGDLYHLDPYDAELDLWAYRLGLRPPRWRLELEEDDEGEGKSEGEGEGEPDGTTDAPGLGIGAYDAERMERRRDRRSADIARLKRAVLEAYPPDAPAALVLFDVDTGEVERFTGEAIAEVPGRLADYDVLAGHGIRPILGGLGVDFRGLRLHELRPPQKTLKVSETGSPLKLTMEMLLRGSCGIRRRRADAKTLDKLVASGSVDRLATRLEPDVRDLAALYHYGRLHGAVYAHWRRIDARLRISWLDYDEWRIHRWITTALAHEQPLEIVTTAALEAGDPWERSEWCTVFELGPYTHVFVTADRQPIEDWDAQRIRFARPGPWHAPLPPELAGRSDQTTPADHPERILRFRITLRDIRPLIWRVIEVPESASFWDLHVAIQDAFGWLDCHLHVFTTNPGDASANRGSHEIGIPFEADFEDGPEIEPGWRVPVLRHLDTPGIECAYLYDFGDSWEHRVKLEAIEPADPALDYPRIVDGRHACPPEDVGGAPGYAHMLEVLKNPRDEDYESFVEWLGGPFDPLAFEPGDVIFDDAGERWVHAFRAG